MGRPVGTVRSRLGSRPGTAPRSLGSPGRRHPGRRYASSLARDATASAPAALVHATIRAATRFAAIRAATTTQSFSAQAVVLCQGVLHTMLWTQLKTIAAFVLATGTLLATGAGVAAVHATKDQVEDRAATGSDDGADRAQVVRSLSFDNYSLVPGETTIISILPANAKVTNGQLVCELDPTRIEEHLADQKRKTQAAEAAYRNAKLTREVAEPTVLEYTEGIHKQDMATVLGELRLAAAELTRVIDRVDWASRMHAKGYTSKAQVDAEDISLQKALVALEQAATKREVLEKYTKEKTIKELKSEVEKARAEELVRKATWELEMAKTKHLERDIARCKIHAPAAGDLILGPGIDKGASVREHQLIFRVLIGTRAEPPR